MRVIASAFTLGAVVHREHVERPAYRMGLVRIERELEAAFRAAESVFRLGDLFAHHIRRQLVVFDKPHDRSVSRECAE